MLRTPPPEPPSLLSGSIGNVVTKLTPLPLLACLFAACGAAEFPGEPAPAFSGRTLSGQKFSNETLKGKVVLIQFWATWCGYCRRDQPAVEEIAKKYGKELTILAVSVNESKPVIREYLAKSPRSVTVVATEDTNLTRLFQPRGFPSYLALNKGGNIAGAREGAVGFEELEALVKSAGIQ